jgi:hypothetical protein
MVLFFLLPLTLGASVLLVQLTAHPLLPFGKSRPGLLGNPVPNDLTREDFEQFKLRRSETLSPHSLSSVADLYT